MSFANRVGCYRKASARKKKTMTSKRAPLIDDDGEVRELTEADLRRMSPATEVLAPKMFADLLDMNAKARCGCQNAPAKPASALELSPDVMASFKATGQT